MRLILGLDQPTAGSVTVNGKRYAEHRAFTDPDQLDLRRPPGQATHLGEVMRPAA